MEKIAILTGGDSAEYNISLLSANTVLKHLNKKKYEAVIVHLKNEEYTVNNQKINTSDFSYINGSTKIKFDKIFIAIHGHPAENGLIQEYFDNLNLPYTSCNGKVSALTFDKFECNKVLKTLKFTCADSAIIYSKMNFSEIDLIEKLGLPCFVKPNGAGSSYGISKVTEKADFSKAIKKALLHDKKVIIESFIDGIEVSCSVYLNAGKVSTLPITEIESKNDFFDYEAKYEGKSKEITPARISNQIASKINQTTIDIYKKMKLTGICRIDFIIKNDVAYIIEINTIPGLTDRSIIIKQLEVANISLTDFFDICLSNIN
jgi:D-alanine-D-alanine ligase